MANIRGLKIKNIEAKIPNDHELYLFFTNLCYEEVVYNKNLIASTGRCTSDSLGFWWRGREPVYGPGGPES